jgi:hypothetical protein
MATLLHQNARCPHIGPKEGGENWMLTGGLLPFPRTGCVLYARAILPYRTSRDEKGDEMDPNVCELKPDWRLGQTSRSAPTCGLKPRALLSVPNLACSQRNLESSPMEEWSHSGIDIRAEAHGAATQLPEAPEPDQCASRAMQVPNRQRSRRTRAEGAPQRTSGDPWLRSRTRGFPLSW